MRPVDVRRRSLRASDAWPDRRPGVALHLASILCLAREAGVVVELLDLPADRAAPVELRYLRVVALAAAGRDADATRLLAELEAAPPASSPSDVEQLRGLAAQVAGPP